MKVAAVVLNFNSARRTIECCEHMTDDSSGLSVIVVDNGSWDADLAMLREFCCARGVQLIVAPENRGYSSGNNLGIAAALTAGARHVLIVNPDVLISPEDIARLSCALGADSRALFCGPKVLNAEGRVDVFAQRFRNHDISAVYLLKYPLSLLCRPFTRRYFNSERDFNQSTPCITTSGCCVMFKREYFDLFGLFDEDFFLYSEEVIWGTNVARSAPGQTCLYVGDASAIHDHPGRPGAASAVTVRNRMRSDLIYCHKYLKCRRRQVLGLAFYYWLAYHAFAIRKKDFRKSRSEFCDDLRGALGRYQR